MFMNFITLIVKGLIYLFDTKVTAVVFVKNVH